MLAGSRSEEEKSEDLPNRLFEKEHSVSMHWLGVSWIMLADVMGTSVLSFDFVAAQLGWVMLCIFLVVYALLSMFTATLMSKTFVQLKEFGIDVKSMGEAAYYTIGGKWAFFFVTFVVYGYAFLGNATYLLVLGSCVQSVVYNYNLNFILAVAISGLICLPFLIYYKHITQSTWLCFGNLLLLLLVIALGLGSIVARGRGDHIVTEVFPRPFRIDIFFQASTNILYAYAGHWMYFELISHMDKPQDFPKVLSVNIPLQLFCYALTACLAYAYVGKAAGFNGIIQEMPRGPLYQFANVALFLHVLIVFVIKAVIFTSFIRKLIAPTWIGRKMQEAPKYDFMVQSTICILNIIVCGLLVIAIPHFSLFLGLVGGVFGVPISFFFPVLFYLGAKFRYSRIDPNSVSPRKILPFDINEVTWKDVALFAIMYSFVLCVSIEGTYKQISDIIAI